VFQTESKQPHTKGIIMGKQAYAQDAMIRRLEQELEERSNAAQGIISIAQDAERDLTQGERENLAHLRDRIGSLKGQLDDLESVSKMASDVGNRMRQLDQATTIARRNGGQEVEYRSAGAWALDSYKASIGDRQAHERLEVFYRAAAHQKTPDNLGIVPDPVVGNVINFIDSARPLVSFLGAQSMPSATWHRPRVTQHTSIAPQGSAGAPSDEKSELVSQKMLITRLTANAVTYGGYVNVSRQNIDFSSPQVLDIIINDMAAQYAIQTEAALAAELASTGTTAVGYGATPTTATVSAALWSAVAQVYAATKGQGRMALAVSPGRLGTFGQLFVPINPQNAISTGFNAGSFGQGVMGSISGIPVIMSSGLPTNSAFLFSTAGIEAFEQRVGTLQVTEPSVLGVQVAYAGYFTALTIEEDAIVPLTAT
jgi:HK97 family phage major capsid protein